MPEYSTLLLWATIGSALSLLISVASAVLSSRLTRRVATEIENYIVKDNIIIKELKLTNSAFGILQRIIREKELPLSITIRHKKKRFVLAELRKLDLVAKISLTPTIEVERKPKLEIKEKTDVVRKNLMRNLALADMMTVAAVGAGFLFVLSFVAMLRPMSSWDLLAIAIAPVAFLIIVIAAMFIPKKRKPSP